MIPADHRLLSTLAKIVRVQTLLLQRASVEHGVSFDRDISALLDGADHLCELVAERDKLIALRGDAADLTAALIWPGGAA